MPIASPTGAVATTRPAGSRRGETLRYTGFAVGDGEFDPHRTQAGPLYGQQALVFSRLLAYQSQLDGTVAADLAVALPERPDAQTYIFRVHPAARWHQRAPLNGRPVTAEDVKFSIERQLSGDASFVRKAQWTNIEAIEIPQPGTVLIRVKTPLATMANVFADVNSFIVAPEVAKDGFTLNNQIGSGPFAWADWSEGKFASAARNPAWHGGDGRPYLDGVSVTQPTGAEDIEAGLRTKKLDAAFVGRPAAEKLRRAIPALAESTVGQSRFFGMRFFLPQFPYNDQRFRSAVSIALDRREMIRNFFGDSGEVNPWVSWPVKRWSLPQAELAGFAGYRPGTSGRDADLKEATALLAAFTSEKKLPDDLPLFVVDDAERALGMGSLMKEQLQKSLGLTNVSVHPMPLGDLVNRLLTGQAPWAAGPDSGWIDLDDWVYPYFHSEGTKNSFPLRDQDMDGLINAQRLELDEAKRREIGFQIQRKLLTLNAGVNFVSERVVALAWPYVRGFPLDAADGYQHRFADCWIDTSDATFRGR